MEGYVVSNFFITHFICGTGTQFMFFNRYHKETVPRIDASRLVANLIGIAKK